MCTILIIFVVWLTQAWIYIISIAYDQDIITATPATAHQITTVEVADLEGQVGSLAAALVAAMELEECQIPQEAAQAPVVPQEYMALDMVIH